MTDIATSALSTVDAIKRIAKRSTIVEDPKCRKLIQTWLEKHPVLAWFSAHYKGPDLRVAGLDGTYEELTHDRFVDRYLNAYFTHRAKNNWPEGECIVTPEEDKLILSELGLPESRLAELGLSQAMEDQIYTASSRTAATALNLYAPGAGNLAAQAADSISSLITGRQMAPQPPKDWASKHWILAKLTSPKLATISGTPGHTALASGVVK
jgi:hypothetical protein